jgi:predicted alpha/beta-hydrolase family hydrolase
VFCYAPGASSNVHDPFGRFACRELASHGFISFRFQFPYIERGRRVPDRPAVLEATWGAVIEFARQEGQQIVVGGRSMGGRIASQVVAGGIAVDALVLLAYPLHPPGRPEKTRAEHLPAIRVPVLFCTGTRDAFASPEELEAAARLLEAGSLHLLADADHGFNVPKAAGRTREDVWREVLDAMLAWLP